MSSARFGTAKFTLAIIGITGMHLFAQVRPGPGGSTPRPSVSSASPTSPVPQGLFVHGNVALANGVKLTEPVAIERVCNGAVRKEGYTDFKGNFEIQLGQGDGSRDAAESGRDVFQNSGNRGPTQGMGSDLGISNPNTSRSPDVTHSELLGCELRASLPGFTSTTAMLRVDGSSWDLNVGTIVLKRMENVKGDTVSLTSMSAPPDAKRAYEKAEKAAAAHKYAEAEKELSKAVSLYPMYAAAWSMLGEVHRNQNKLDSAREEYNRAIAADPRFVSPYFGLAILAVHEKNWEDTVKYTNQVAELNPTAFPLIFMYNGAANFYLGRLDAAEESARRFKQLDTGHQHADSTLLLSNILAAKRDYEGAAQQLEEYLNLVPNAANAGEVKSQLEQLRRVIAARKP